MRHGTTHRRGGVRSRATIHMVTAVPGRRCAGCHGEWTMVSCPACGPNIFCPVANYPECPGVRHYMAPPPGMS